MTTDNDDVFNAPGFRIDPEIADIVGGMKGDNYLELAEKLGSLCCTDREVAAFFGVSYTTLKNRKQKDEPFREALERGKRLGMLSLRRAQMELAREGNATIQIWLGKQLLEQRDQTRISIDLEGCDNHREVAEQILDAVARGDITVQDGAMMMNMARTVIDEQTLDAMKRIEDLEKITHGQ